MELVARCFPLYSAWFDWANIDPFSLNREQLANRNEDLPKTLLLPSASQSCLLLQRRARVIKWMWEKVKRGFGAVFAVLNPEMQHRG
jgi:hypothetical protein